MKIACLIHSLDGGGAERVIAGLASRLVDRQHHVSLITLDHAGCDRHPLSADVVRYPLDVMTSSRNPWTRATAFHKRWRSLGRTLDQIQPDVLLSFCDRTNLLALAVVNGLGPLPAWRRAARERLPVVIAERTDPSQQPLGALAEYVRARLYPQASAVIALTDPSAAFLRNLGCRNVKVVPSAVDVPPQQSDRNRAAGHRRIVGVGRLAHEKGFDRLIEAFAMIADQAEGWTLRIIGEGSQRGELLSRADELQVADRVSLPGWIRPVWGELCDATLFALPSRYEGFPSALLEAMAVGVPAVAVDCESGPRAIVRNGVDGLLVENQVAALSAGLLAMIRGSAKREQLGNRATEVVDRFSWEAMVDCYEQVLRKSRVESEELRAKS